VFSGWKIDPPFTAKGRHPKADNLIWEETAHLGRPCDFTVAQLVHEEVFIAE